MVTSSSFTYAVAPEPIRAPSALPSSNAVTIPGIDYAGTPVSERPDAPEVAR